LNWEGTRRERAKWTSSESYDFFFFFGLNSRVRYWSYIKIACWKIKLVSIPPPSPKKSDRTSIVLSSSAWSS
jgi:hypothetical protein